MKTTLWRVDYRTEPNQYDPPNNTIHTAWFTHQDDATAWTRRIPQLHTPTETTGPYQVDTP